MLPDADLYLSLTYIFVCRLVVKLQRVLGYNTNPNQRFIIMHFKSTWQQEIVHECLIII